MTATIVVDVANVMGSRPDGWWRDRAGAAVRLHADLARLAARGEQEFIMVLEGAAKAAAGRVTGDPRVVLASGSGDDAIVALVKELVREHGGACHVVTADRELRARCTAAGAKVLGPSWLLGQLRP